MANTGKYLLSYVQKPRGVWTWGGPLAGDANADALVDPMKKAFNIAAGDVNPDPVVALYFTEDQQIIVVRKPEGGPPISDSVASFPVHVLYPSDTWPKRAEPVPAKRGRSKKVPSAKPTPQQRAELLKVTRDPRNDPETAKIHVPNIPAGMVTAFLEIPDNEHLKRAMEVAYIGEHTISVVADDSEVYEDGRTYQAADYVVKPSIYLPLVKASGLKIAGMAVHLEDDPHPPVPKAMAEADIQVEMAPIRKRDIEDPRRRGYQTHALLVLDRTREQARVALAARPGPWPLTAESQRLLDRIVDRLKWPPDAITAALRVARTIAAMDGAEDYIDPSHLAEAVQYQHLRKLHPRENPSGIVYPKPILSYVYGPTAGRNWTGTAMNHPWQDHIAELIRLTWTALPIRLRAKCQRISILDVGWIQVALSGPMPRLRSLKLNRVITNDAGVEMGWTITFISDRTPAPWHPGVKPEKERVAVRPYGLRPDFSRREGWHVFFPEGPMWIGGPRYTREHLEQYAARINTRRDWIAGELQHPFTPAQMAESGLIPEGRW